MLARINDSIDQDAYEPAGEDTLLTDDNDGKASTKEYVASVESQRLRMQSQSFQQNTPRTHLRFSV